MSRRWIVSLPQAAHANVTGLRLLWVSVSIKTENGTKLLFFVGGIEYGAGKNDQTTLRALVSKLVGHADGSHNKFLADKMSESPVIHANGGLAAPSHIHSIYSKAEVVSRQGTFSRPPRACVGGGWAGMRKLSPRIRSKIAGFPAPRPLRLRQPQ